jgi:hypothetical protein
MVRRNIRELGGWSWEPKKRSEVLTQWEEMDKIKIALINVTLPSSTKPVSLTTHFSLGDGGCMLF